LSRGSVVEGHIIANQGIKFASPEAGVHRLIATMYK